MGPLKIRPRVAEGKDHFTSGNAKIWRRDFSGIVIVDDKFGIGIGHNTTTSGIAKRGKGI